MRMRASAEADLRWYWGTGSATWAGDAGLRSPLGGQLDVLRAGMVSQHQSVDASQAEDLMHHRMGAAARAREIEGRLRSIPDALARLLRRHYTEKALPYDISPTANRTPTARRICPSGRVEELRSAIRSADQATLAALISESERAVRAAVLAYETSSVEDERRLQVNDPRKGKR